MAEFEIRWSADKQYYWRFQANNNEVVAVSETYTTKAAARNGIDVLQREAAGAKINDLTGR